MAVLEGRAERLGEMNAILKRGELIIALLILRYTSTWLYSHTLREVV